jgi:hypothetical protein
VLVTTASEPCGDGQTGRDETPAQRADRNFSELLQELRVAQTGVQILFAFLLTMPFQARFETLDAFHRGTYVVTLLLSAGATALLIAPVAYHRATFGRGKKSELVSSTNRLTGIGLVMLALAMNAAILLIVDVVVGRPAGIVAAVLGVGCFAVLWYVLPSRRARSGDPSGR